MGFNFAYVSTIFQFGIGIVRTELYFFVFNFIDKTCAWIIYYFILCTICI